ncbi:MAG: ATPase, T2SS/T4P/T4SS family [Proteobacteria bacterium]|nr:ATPase, T2SS/T4P/T4SS family [Pseudomonadota bacterium]MDA1309247.1 ATPase, T2SS/T4P/T4SS family [Pseudomonadota bacterium]
MVETAEFSDVLLNRGLIDLQAATATRRLMEESGESLHVLLTRQGLVDERDMALALADHLKLPLAAAASFPVSAIQAGGVSVPFLRRARVLPLSEDDACLSVAMADPLDSNTIRSLRILVGKPITVQVAVPADIDRTLDRLYGPARSATSSKTETARRGEDAASDAPAIRAVDALIARAIAHGASDLHIEPHGDGIRVRYRIDGHLIELGAAPENYLAAMLISRIKVLADLNIAEKRLPQDGRASLTIQGRAVDIRVSTVPTLGGESVVLRLLDQTAAPRDIDQLGLSTPVLSALAQALTAPNGLVLATGPTGSGKTTTLYGALGRINAASRKILTVEDPIEYRLSGINQIQVNARIGLGFPTLLRSIVRQDPDIIMVGEIRDEETARLAAQASLTGHLVLSSLHTNDAASGITRLLDMGIEPYLLTASLRAVLAQRLVRRLCPSCKASRQITDEERALLGPNGQDLIEVCEPVGCAACHDTGYAGRLVLSEILVMTPALRQAVTDGAGLSQLRALAADGTAGGSLLDSGIANLRARETSLAEIIAATGMDGG